MLLVYLVVKQMPGMAESPQPVKQQKDTEFPFAVSVAEVYDGPLDLLLDLIRKQDIDIYDIPIAQITAQYLAYVERIKQLDVNVAAEFIYMASVLIQIKSRMLLPRDPVARGRPAGRPAPGAGEPAAGARALQDRGADAAAEVADRGRGVVESGAQGLQGRCRSASRNWPPMWWTWCECSSRSWSARKTRPVIDVDEDRVTVAQMIDFFRRRLSLEERPVRLKQVLSALKSRQALICAFLALLEMVRLQAILLRQDKVFSDIIVKKNTMFDTVFGEGGAAAMRDDWK